MLPSFKRCKYWCKKSLALQVCLLLPVINTLLRGRMDGEEVMHGWCWLKLSVSLVRKDIVQYLSSLWKYCFCNSTNISMCVTCLSFQHLLGWFVLPCHMFWVIHVYSAQVSAHAVLTLLMLLTWSACISLMSLTRQCFWGKLYPKALPHSWLGGGIGPSCEQGDREGSQAWEWPLQVLPCTWEAPSCHHVAHCA